MPLVRYFVYIGGVLLSLLCLADWYLPKPDVAAASADIDRSTIRLRSSQRWPEAIRIDTSAVVPPLPVVAASDFPDNVPASTREAYAAALPRQATEVGASKKLEAVEKPVRRSKPAGRSMTRNNGRRLANYQPRSDQGWPQAGW